MDRLSPLSYAFLAAEDVDPAASLVIGSMAVVEGPAPTLEEVRELVAGRLSTVPRYAQRLAPATLGLRAPAWVDDPDLDLTRHVTLLGVPHPGGPDEIAAVVAEAMTRRMDRAAPLWDITVCEGLADGRWGLLSRVHHALADGVSGTGLYRVVFDADGGTAPAAPLPPHPGAAPGITRRGVLDTIGTAARGALALGTAAWPVSRSGLTGPLGAERRYAWTEVSIAASADVRHDLGASLNDLVLAAVAGGLRELLLERGRQPDPHALRSLLPVSSRAPTSAGVPDNQVTLMLSLLPVEVDDPLERVRAVHQRVAALRGTHEPEAGVALQEAATLVPFPVLRWALRWGLRLPQQQVSTVTTNVPGPRVPLTCLGRPVHQLLPFVPIADRVRLGVAVLSYADTLAFGITADAGTTPDVGVVAAGITASWQAVVAAAP